MLENIDEWQQWIKSSAFSFFYSLFMNWVTYIAYGRCCLLNKVFSHWFWIKKNCVSSSPFFFSPVWTFYILIDWLLRKVNIFFLLSVKCAIFRHSPHQFLAKNVIFCPLHKTFWVHTRKVSWSLIHFWKNLSGTYDQIRKRTLDTLNRFTFD